jgi:hypothetical protein
MQHFAPGARLEAELQFDAMWQLSVKNPAWAAIGLSYAGGVAIAPPKTGKVPPGLFNLFIQYKRSDYLHGYSSTHRRHFSGPYYRFGFASPRAQLGRLQALAASGASAIEVVYAAPEFHTVDQLMDAMRAKSIVSRSVIVKASQLNPRHRAFNFRTGHNSIQNPDPEVVESTSGDGLFISPSSGDLLEFRDTVAHAYAALGEDREWSKMWRVIREGILTDLDIGADSRDATLIDQFAEVASFAWMSGLGWFLSGPASDASE